MIGLFCKRALKKRLYSAKETYDFKEPTNRSHPISKVPSFTYLALYHLYYHGPYGVALVSRLLKITGLFAKKTYKRDYILQKRPMILSILLTVATPYHLYITSPAIYTSQTVSSRCHGLYHCVAGFPSTVFFFCGGTVPVSR